MRRVVGLTRVTERTPSAHTALTAHVAANNVTLTWTLWPSGRCSLPEDGLRILIY